MKLLLLLFLLPIYLFSYDWSLKHNEKGQIVERIVCPDSLNCYALVQHELLTKVYKSTDRGGSWILQYETDPGIEWPPVLLNVMEGCSPYPGYFYMVFFEDGYIKMTKDDFKSIEIINMGIEAPIYDISMLDTNIGIAINDSVYFLTSDGWESFETYERPFDGSFNHSFFKSQDTIFMILSTKNFTAFTIYDLVFQSFYTIKFDHSLSYFTFINGSLGFLCGDKKSGFGNQKIDLIYRTKDGGLSWELVLEKEVAPKWGLQDISFKNEKIGMAVGQFGKAVITNDGGDTWEYLELSEEMLEYSPPTMRVEWAGDYAIVGNYVGKIFRLENYIFDDVYSDDLPNKAVLNIRQTLRDLLISIDDEKFRKYKLQIFDIMGNVAAEQELSSGVGTLYVPYDISGLVSGAYLYMISCQGVVIKTGRFLSITNY